MNFRDGEWNAVAIPGFNKQRRRVDRHVFRNADRLHVNVPLLAVTTGCRRRILARARIEEPEASQIVVESENIQAAWIAAKPLQFGRRDAMSDEVLPHRMIGRQPT